MVEAHMFRSTHTETVTTSSAYGNFYALRERPHVSIAEDVVKLLYYVDKHKDEFVNDLKEYVEIPNISGVFDHRDDVNNAIKLTEMWLKKLGIKYECFDIGWHEMSEACCKLPNVILATLGFCRKKRTVLVYAHLDVASHDSQEWDTNPFELIEKNKALYGKGTVLGKGPLLCWFHAIEAYQKSNVKIPVNIKFAIESMHENGSTGFEHFLKSKRPNFLAPVSCIVINDSEWLGPTMPCLSYGCIGICRFVITVEQQEDSDPRADIEKIFDNLSDSNGKILITGVNDPVIQISPEEENLYDTIDFDFEAIRGSMPPDKINWDKVQMLMKFWRLPDILVSEIEECTCEKDDKSILKRRFTLKIVPLQLPDYVAKHVTSYVYDVCKKINCQSKVHCEMVYGSRPWLENFTHPNYEAARRATIQIYKEDPNLIREDREFPTVLTLQRILDCSILLLPLANSTCNSGKVNENISLKNFFEGTKLLIAYLYQLHVV